MKNQWEALDVRKRKKVANIIWDDLKEGGSIGLLRTIVQEDEHLRKWGFKNSDDLVEYMNQCLGKARRENTWIVYDFVTRFSSIPGIEAKFKAVMTRDD